jgi:hypothetical protein
VLLGRLRRCKIQCIWFSMALALYMVLRGAEYPVRLCIGHPRGNRNSSPKLASEVVGSNYEFFFPVHLFKGMRNDLSGTRKRTLIDTICSLLLKDYVDLMMLYSVKAHANMSTQRLLCRCNMPASCPGRPFLDLSLRVLNLASQANLSFTSALQPSR